MERVGFIGLGNLGSALARRIGAAGHPLTVFDRVAERGVPDGAEVAPSARAVADRAAVVFACLPSRDASLQVAAEVAEGSAVRVLVETSTLGPSAIGEVSGVLGDRVALVDCPVSGGPAGADAGTLAAIVSADPAALALADIPIASLTPHRFVVGDRPGPAQTAKLVNNAIGLTSMVTACEAMVMGVKAGLDPIGLLAAINASSGRNHTTLTALPNAILTGTFAGGGPLRLAVKDLGAVIAEARALGTPVRTVERALEVWREAVELVGGDEDFTHVISPMEDVAGVEVRGRPGTGRIARMSLAPEDLTATLDRIAAHVDEARAAVALMQEGDPSAMQELDGTVDRMAAAVADLKGQTAAGGRF